MIVETADMSHLGEIVDFLIQDFHAPYADVFPPVDHQKVVLHVGSHLHDGVVFFIRGGRGHIAGVIAGRESAPWFSKQKHVAEGVFFVHPSMRQSRAAVLLLRALKDYARSKGLALMAGITSGDDLERKDKFFNRQGFARIGGIYKTKG